VTQIPQSQLVTAKSGSNLAAAFFLLPKVKRRAMVALYAFCREVDDAADDDSGESEESTEEEAADAEESSEEAESDAESGDAAEEESPEEEKKED